LAIECDGASYHAAPTARDRDRLRQQHLEALGWRFHRIWSTDWYLRKQEEVDRAMTAYETAMKHAQASGDSQPPQRARPAPEPRINARATTEGPPPSSRGLPPVPKKGSITEYSSYEIDVMVNWVRADGKLRTDDELVDAVRAALGFEKRGKRIEKAIRDGIGRTHRS
jgi:hypothetical protein